VFEVVVVARPGILSWVAALLDALGGGGIVVSGMRVQVIDRETGKVCYEEKGYDEATSRKAQAMIAAELGRLSVAEFCRVRSIDY
jgi:hypothetical protein